MAVARLKRNDFSEVQPIDDDEEFVTGRRPDDSTIFVPEDEAASGGEVVEGVLPGTGIGSRETPRHRSQTPRSPHPPRVPPPPRVPRSPQTPPVPPPITPPTAPPATPGPTATPPQPTAPTPVTTQPPVPTPPAGSPVTSPTGVAPLPVARRPSLFGERSRGLLGSQEGLFGGGIGVPGIGESQPRSILDTLVQLFSQR